MLTGNVFANEDLSVYPKAIQRAIRYYCEHDLAAHAPGRFALDGDRLILQVIDQDTAPRETLRPEVHRKYVDVQFLAAGGPERIGWYPDMGDSEVDEELLASRDIIFYKNNPQARESVIEMQPGSYAAFFPGDVHIPGIQAGDAPARIRKIVMKVAVDTLCPPAPPSA